MKIRGKIGVKKKNAFSYYDQYGPCSSTTSAPVQVGWGSKINTFSKAFLASDYILPWSVPFLAQENKIRINAFSLFAQCGHALAKQPLSQMS